MPQPGYLAHGVCYSSLSQAADVYFSANPVVFTAGDPAYFSRIVKSSDGVWVFYNYKVQSGLTTLVSSQPVPLVFASCDPTESFFDGITVGWGLAAAIILAASIRLMRRAF